MRLTDIENQLLASDHLSDEELDALVKSQLSSYAWYLRNLKWNTHFNVFKHRSLAEIQGMADLTTVMMDIVKVTHPKLLAARNTLRLYLSQETPSQKTMKGMKKLQGELQDAGRDEVELNNPLITASYLRGSRKKRS